MQPIKPEYLNYQRRPPMQREYRWYANIADIEFRQRIDITALLIRTATHLSNRKTYRPGRFESSTVHQDAADKAAIETINELLKEERD